MNPLKLSPKGLLEHSLKLIEELPPLSRKREPVVAGVWGVLLGGIGLGWYFRSWIDLFLPIAIWVVTAILAVPTGETLLALAPVFCGLYGYRRATISNRKLAGQTEEGAGIAAPDTRLARLDDLRAKQLLSESEYTSKRSQILAEL